MCHLRAELTENTLMEILFRNSCAPLHMLRAVLWRFQSLTTQHKGFLTCVQGSFLEVPVSHHPAQRLPLRQTFPDSHTAALQKTVFPRAWCQKTTAIQKSQTSNSQQKNQPRSHNRIECFSWRNIWVCLWCESLELKGLAVQEAKIGD